MQRYSLPGHEECDCFDGFADQLYAALFADLREAGSADLYQRTAGLRAAVERLRQRLDPGQQPPG